MRKFLFIVFIAMLPVIGSLIDAASAETNQALLGVQTGYLYGNTSYSISEYYGSSGFQSKLEFPLQTVMAGINMTYRPGRVNSRGKVIFLLSWMTNIGNGSGKVKDSDWLSDDNDIYLVGSAHSGLDIYSESDMRLKANIFECRADIPTAILKKVSFGPMIGIKHQRFEYDILNVNQLGYGPYESYFTGSAQGLVGTYEVNYTMMYFGISGHFTPDDGSDVAAAARIGLAPLVIAEDEDDHVLRYKASDGSTTGQAFFVSVETESRIGGNVMFKLNGEYMRIFTKGTQNQYFYAGEDAGTRLTGIPDRIDSRQLFLSAQLVFRI